MWITLLKATSACLKPPSLSLIYHQHDRKAAKAPWLRFHKYAVIHGNQTQSLRGNRNHRWFCGFTPLVRASFKTTRCSLEADEILIQSIYFTLASEGWVNFDGRSPSATRLYCPPSEMLFGVVPAVFLFFSAFLLDVFTEDINYVNTGAVMTRLSGGTETLRGKKRHCWHKNKNLGWNHWNSSYNCIKSFFHNSCFVTFHFHFIGGGRGSHTAAKMEEIHGAAFIWFLSVRSGPHIRTILLTSETLYPDRVKSFAVLWTAYVVQPEREGSQICSVLTPLGCLDGNCVVNIACQRSSVAFVFRCRNAETTL